MTLVKLKEIDHKTKFKIFGYTRRIQKELSRSIPIMIQYIVASEERWRRIRPAAAARDEKKTPSRS